MIQTLDLDAIQTSDFTSSMLGVDTQLLSQLSDSTLPCSAISFIHLILHRWQTTLLSNIAATRQDLLIFMCVMPKDGSL